MSSDFTEFPCTWFLLVITERGGARHALVGFLIRWLLDGSVLTRPINSDSAIGLSKCLGFFILVKRMHLHLTALFSQRMYQGVFSLLLFQTTHENRKTGLRGQKKSILSPVSPPQAAVNCRYPGKSMARVTTFFTEFSLLSF